MKTLKFRSNVKKSVNHLILTDISLFWYYHWVLRISPDIESYTHCTVSGALKSWLKTNIAESNGDICPPFLSETKSLTNNSTQTLSIHNETNQSMISWPSSTTTWRQNIIFYKTYMYIQMKTLTLIDNVKISVVHWFLYEAAVKIIRQLHLSYWINYLFSFWRQILNINWIFNTMYM